MATNRTYQEQLLQNGTFAPERWWFARLEPDFANDGPIFLLVHPELGEYGMHAVMLHAVQISAWGELSHRSLSVRRDDPMPPEEHTRRALAQPVTRHHDPASNLLRGLRLTGASQAAIDGYAVMRGRGPLADHFTLPSTTSGCWHLDTTLVAPDGARRWYVDLPFAFAAVHGGHVAAGTVPTAPEVAAMHERMRAAGLARVEAALHPEALAALTDCPAFGVADYEFFAEPGEVGARRRNSAASFPVLTRRLVSNGHLGRAAGGDISFQDAFSQWLGKPFSTAHLRRINALAIENDASFKNACRCFADLPPNWMPADPAALEAALDVLHGVHGFLRTATGEREPDVAPLLHPSGGRWADYRALLAKRASYDGARDTRFRVLMDRAGRRAHDTVDAFARELMVPVLAHQGLRGDGEVSAAERRRAWEALFAGKGVAAVIELADLWHAEHERYRGRMPTPLPQADRSGWPALFQPWRAPNGLELSCLLTPLELAEEGSQGFDSNGVRGLHHCVGSYADRCLTGQSFIVSVRRPGGGSSTPYARLSTAEFGVAPAADPGSPPTLRLVQHHGWNDGDPPAEAQAALRAFRTAFQAGEVPVEGRALLPRRRGEAIAKNALESQCRYDWTERDNVVQALIAWERILPRHLRGRDLDALVAVFQGASIPDAPPNAPEPVTAPSRRLGR